MIGACVRLEQESNTIVLFCSYRGDGDKLVAAVEKLFPELEMGLQHLQQNIDIPDVTLTAPPYITLACRRAAEERRQPVATDIQNVNIDDSQVLNALQATVIKWTREIQKVLYTRIKAFFPFQTIVQVTKLDRDPASGTALQEINFWLNLQRAFVNVRAKVESPEVKLTLEVLKLGTRFQATLQLVWVFCNLSL
jgi:dynein heavy chain 1